MKRIIYTVAAAAAITVGSAVAAAPAFAAGGPASVSAYYYNPSGQALGGPQPVALHAGVPFGPRYLAKITQKMTNADITGKVITVTGHFDNASVADQPNGGDATPSNANARLYFQGGSGGTDTSSPDGYMGQSWWSNPTDVTINDHGSFILTVPVDPSQWSDWNGQFGTSAPDVFAGAISHVRQLGISFGGGWFFENGVAGSGSVTIDSISAS